MPPRLNKRQQREQEELAALSQAKSAEADLSEDEEVTQTPARPTATSAFAALQLEDHGQEDESEEDEPAQAAPKSKKSKKKKKKTASAAAPAAPSPAPSKPVPSQPTPPTKAKDGKKGKGKGKPVKDEIDLALEEMAKKYPERKAVVASIEHANKFPATKALRDLLSVSLKHLDGDAEMRRFFGAKVVNAASSGQKYATGTRANFVRPKSDWPPATQRFGLVMRELTPIELSSKDCALEGERWWTMEHSQAYKTIQQQFLGAVASYDPQSLVALLQVYPWHVDTLLQLSEYFKHTEEYNRATDFIDRAIFAYERGFSSMFNVTNGASRLDFDRIENRPFFLALHRTIINLERRGCLRAAFETSRLLLALDPSSDPHGALFRLDYLAFKANMKQWLLDVWDAWEKMQDEGVLGPDDNRIELKWLPGWNWARALAMRDLEAEKGDREHKRSTEALEEAMLRFPQVIPVLADKADITLSEAARKHPATRIQPGFISDDPAGAALNILAHLYAHRSSSLWRTHSTWVRSTVEKILPRLPKSPSIPSGLASASLSLTIARHVVVCDITTLRKFISPQLLARSIQGYDPLPPTTSTTSYDAKYFASVERRRGRGRDGREELLVAPDGGELDLLPLLLRLLQQPAARARFFEELDAHPEMMDDLDHGLLQELGRRVPEFQERYQERIERAGDQPQRPPAADPPQQGQSQQELQQQPLQQQRQQDHAPAVRPPGGFDEDDLGADEDDEDEILEEPQGTLPGRVFTGIYNFLFGAPPADAGDDPPEEDDDVD